MKERTRKLQTQPKGVRAPACHDQLQLGPPSFGFEAKGLPEIKRVKLWIDVKQMDGGILQRVVEAVEGSRAVICWLSEK